LVRFVNKTQTAKTTPKSTNHIKVQKITKMSDKQILQYAVKLYKKNYLTKSKPYFEKLFKKSYKVDIVSFYLGKINYYKKHYKDAISYFKKSMMANDEAHYIPELLFFSALSFEKVKDIENAKNFYMTLIDVYPDSSFVKKAQKNLAKLK